MTDATPRQPPHSIPAEQAAIGGILLDNRKWPVVADMLTVDTFFHRRHAQTFAAIQRLAVGRMPFDVVTVAEELERTGELDKIGGLAFVGELANNTPSAANVRAYAEVVSKHAQRRNLIRIAEKAIQRAYDGDEPAEIVTDTESALLGITADDGEQGPRGMSEIMDRYVDELEARQSGNRRGLMTGFADLDQMTTGLLSGQLVIFAGRPGEGKTTVASNIAESAAIRQQRPVLFVSLEMTAVELMDRFASSLSGVPLADIRQGRIDDPAFSAAMEKIRHAPLHIDDGSSLHINQIRARALRLKRKHGLGLVVIDYLQLVRAKAERRHEEVAAISRALKALAKELVCPILALSQLNRASEARHDKRPTMADLRESGQLEQDADIVALIYRDSNLLEGLTVVEIAKQRNGPTDRVVLAAQLDRVRFRDHAGPAEPMRPKKSEYRPYAND